MSIYLGDTPLAHNAVSRNIGEIIQSTIPLSDAGLHLLDGALISGAGSYSAFVTYIAGLVTDYPDLFETEANWQTSVTNYGVCGKFVYDSVNNTVRLPKITGFTEGTTDVTALGDLIEAGLPNITGEINKSNTANNQMGFEYTTSENPSNFISGAFSSSQFGTYKGIADGNGNAHTASKIVFDASLSNPIYGNSSTVQPQAIKVLYYIVVANSVKTNIEVDIDEVMTDLNGKADVDLNNCTKPHIVETYVNGTSWYRIWSDGWIEQGGEIAASTTSVTLLKPYLNTNYNVVMSGSNYGGSDQTLGTSARTVSGFTVSTSSYKRNWQARGY